MPSVSVSIFLLFMLGWCVTNCDAPYLGQTKCPCDEERWTIRAKEYNCLERHYICLLDKHGNLVETCIFRYTITEYEDGCPYIEDFKPGFGPQIGILNTKCKIEGCPTKGARYKVTDIYRYPSCFIPVDLRKNKTYHDERSRVCMSSINDEVKISNNETTPSDREIIFHMPTTCPSQVCCIVSLVFLCVSVAMNFLLVTYIGRTKVKHERKLSTKEKSQYPPDENESTIGAKPELVPMTNEQSTERYSPVD